MIDRGLRFKCLDDLTAELDLLSKGPVEATGRWSYFQILDHCADFIEEGLRPLERNKPAPWVLRATLGRLSKWSMLRKGRFSRGPQGNEDLERMEGDEKKAMTRLRKAIADFKAYAGPEPSHPYFGKISMEDLEKIDAFHAADHLSLVKIKNI